MFVVINIDYFLDFTFSNCFSANVAQYGALYVYSKIAFDRALRIGISFSLNSPLAAWAPIFPKSFYHFATFTNFRGISFLSAKSFNINANVPSFAFLSIQTNSNILLINIA